MFLKVFVLYEKKHHFISDAIYLIDTFSFVGYQERTAFEGKRNELFWIVEACK